MKDQRGFTLIEVLSVIAISAMLLLLTYGLLRDAGVAAVQGKQEQINDQVDAAVFHAGYVDASGQPALGCGFARATDHGRTIYIDRVTDIYLGDDPLSAWCDWNKDSVMQDDEGRRPTHIEYVECDTPTRSCLWSPVDARDVPEQEEQE